MKNVCHVNKLKGKKMDSFNERINSKVGLLTSSNSYKPFGYPWAYDFGKDNNKSIGCLKVPLGEDCKDWAAKLNDNEEIFLHKYLDFLLNLTLKLMIIIWKDTHKYLSLPK